jgi:hypothetical protein
VLIDCETCIAPPGACRDCVVTVLLSMPAHVELDEDEHAAIGTLARAGLVPPLRLAPRTAPGSSGTSRGIA